jgi:Gpi18-like mannosyltransferase
MAPGPYAPVSMLFASAWDGPWYRAIIEFGYPNQVVEAGGRATASQLAFFPLYPAIAKVADMVLPFRRTTTLVLVAAFFGGVAVCLLWRTTRMLFDERTADRAALLFSFFPGAFIFSFAYAEGLMISLAIVCLAALHRRRWLTAGLAGSSPPRRGPLRLS